MLLPCHVIFYALTLIVNLDYVQTTAIVPYQFFVVLLLHVVWCISCVASTRLHFLGCPHTLQSHKPEPSNPASITLSVMQGESNLHWSWLDLACETRHFGDCQVSLWLLTVQTKHDNSQQKQDISQWNRWWNHTSNWTHLLINSPTHQKFPETLF